MVDNNKKLPDSDAEWTYPYNQVEQTLGGHEVHYNSTPGKESRRLFDPSGTYTEVSTDGKVVTLGSNADFTVISQGSSKSVEAALDVFSRGGTRTNNFGGTHDETGGHQSAALYGSLAGVVKGHSYQHVVEGANHFVSQVGTFHWDNDEHQHHNVAGDKISFIGGTKYEQVSGEHGTHVPTGNYDVQVDQGKVRIFSGDTQLYESSTQITIKVGTNTIVVSSSGVTINAAAHSIYAQGDILTLGASTKIQGGGIVAPPTTFM